MTEGSLCGGRSLGKLISIVDRLGRNEPTTISDGEGSQDQVRDPISCEISARWLALTFFVFGEVWALAIRRMTRKAATAAAAPINVRRFIKSPIEPLL
jgi:hypothetical protein